MLQGRARLSYPYLMPFQYVRWISPCSPEHGKSMVKVQQSAGKERRNIGNAWRCCSAVLFLLSPRGVPSHAGRLHNVHDTTLPKRGGMRNGRARPDTAFVTVRLLSPRSAGRTQRCAECGLRKPTIKSECDRRTVGGRAHLPVQPCLPTRLRFAALVPSSYEERRGTRTHL